MSEHDIKFEIEGLISLLAQNLYADPDVFLREMIQNAHDSILKRRALAAERGAPAPPQGEILIVPVAPRSLRIEDNGAGLTEVEIHEFLSTIGKSGTRELKERLRTSDRATAVELIGQFGIGLLSAFVVADRVEITTLAEGGTALRWTSGGGKRYTVEPGERAHPGTEVTLHLRGDATRYLDLERLRAIVRRYADFIGVRIYLGAETVPANAVEAPWHKDFGKPAERDEAFRAYWEERFTQEHSLEILPIDEAVTVPDPQNEGAFIEGRIRGILGITDRHIPDVNTRGMVDLYIRRMFIAQGHRDLLPTWARFIQGILECDALTPNAARDDVIQNPALAAVRDALGRRILAWLADLSTKKPERFIEIMRWHAYHVLAMAVQDEHEGFFRAVADIVPLESDAGPVTLRDYLASAPVTGGRRTLFYLTERGAVTQFYVLCRARGIRVLNAAEPFAERFLERYATTWPDRVFLSRIDVAGSDAIFQKLEDADPDIERYKDLEAEYGRIFPDLRCIAKVGRFAPHDLPAVLTETRDQKTRREIEDLASNIAIPTYLRGLLGDFLKDRREPLTLHLNANNPTIRRLAKRPTLRDEVTRNALVSLYNNAFLLLARSITADNIQIMFQQYNSVIELMLTLADERATLLAEKASLEARLREVGAGPASRTLAPCITCFVAMPYDKQLTPVFEALCRVLQDVPYVWDVVRADSETRAGTIGDNLRHHLASAHCFVAEISVENPNVMVELGQMKATGKPILLLRRADSLSLPASLAGEIYVEYTGKEDDLAAHLAAEIRKHPRFTKQQGEQRLSEIVLRASAGDRINEAAIRALPREFMTCGDFLAANAADVAKRIGLGPGTVGDAQHYLREHLERAAKP